MTELARLRRAVKEKADKLANRTNKRRIKLPPPTPYRSWFEVDIAIDALQRELEFDYEAHTILWRQPEKLCKYKPDFFVKRKKNGSLLIVEAKGRWTAAERKKMCHVIEQNPRLDIRMLFERDNTLSKRKRSKTYTQWCERHGIKCAVGRAIPQEWLDE